MYSTLACARVRFYATAAAGRALVTGEQRTVFGVGVAHQGATLHGFRVSVLGFKHLMGVFCAVRGARCERWPARALSKVIEARHTPAMGSAELRSAGDCGAESKRLNVFESDCIIIFTNLSRPGEDV